ncbi:MAG: hypothetical protein V3R40_02035 [Gammaproteobacteria bacterium]
MKNNRAVMRLWLVLVVSILMATVNACSSLIATYSQAAYKQATSIKAESLVLMSKGTEPYNQHAQAVAALMLDVDKAYEYAKGRPKNEISAGQWAKIKNPDKKLLGGFLKRWEEQGQLSSAFVEEAKRQVAKAFNQIIELESGKNKERK